VYDRMALNTHDMSDCCLFPKDFGVEIDSYWAKYDEYMRQ
jgi:hypothetical protein